jgi:hypothetical protein
VVVIGVLVIVAIMRWSPPETRKDIKDTVESLIKLAIQVNLLLKPIFQ